MPLLMSRIMENENLSGGAELDVCTADRHKVQVHDAEAGTAAHQDEICTAETGASRSVVLCPEDSIIDEFLQCMRVPAA